MTAGPKKRISFEKETLKNFYDRADEEGRLAAGSGLLELARTREIVERYLPPPPAEIGDVGGGAGIYALWLAQKGYRVHLVDPVAKHIEQARQASKKQPGFPLATTVVGDARWLDWENNSMDFLLFLGPLYHLTMREDRVLALREASRVMRRGGYILAAAISRYASLLDGLFRGFLDDPAFVPIVEKDLVDGQHRNPTDNPAYFTDAFFHRPDEIVSEVEDSGMTLEKLLAVESIGGILSPFEVLWQDRERRESLLRFIRAVESDPSLIGASAHIIAVVKNTK